ncbi:MAG TPA: hypothetical protein IAB72_00415, partial [Candidatus Onthoplasma faecipullorum]|nr:hypothetical protein [Candidatus Onthoplasma faecipullorum]
MTKKTTKKSTILTLRIATAVLLSLIVVLTGVGIYFAFNKKGPSEPEAVVNPLDFATDTWDGETEDNSEFLSGEQLGNRGEHVYTINSASSFVYFVNLVNDENRAKEYNYFKDYTIYLNSNIDLAGHSIQSIGKQVTDGDITTSTFQGTFDGAYYSILNANIVGNGLFGYVENATIQNVGLYNATIDSTETYTGGIAGTAINTNISNVYVRLGSTKGSTVGGLVGSYISTNGTHTITNSFVDNTLIGDRVGTLIGYLDTNHTSQNAVTISNVYYTQNTNPVNSLYFEGTLEENFVTLTNVIYATDISQFSTWNYTSEYSANSDWCDYTYRENSTQLDFRFPLQTGFAKVFLNGSYIENTVTINGTTTDSSTLAESFNQVNANDTAEVHIIVEKVYVEEEAVAKANATLTVTPDVTTTLVRSEGNSENLIVGSSNSQLYIGEEEAQINTPKITLDGNIDHVKSNNQQSGALIYAQGEDLVVGSNVILQNNINNTTGYGGGLSVYNINNDYDPVTNTADTIVISPTVTNCEATYGGGMSIIGSTVDINNANVTNCHAENGGAVAIMDNGSVEQTDQQTLVRTYLNYGGDPTMPLERQSISGSAEIDSGYYCDNSSSLAGGAFYFSIYSSATVTFYSGSEISNNTGGSAGGAIDFYISSSSTSTSVELNIYDANITNNVAKSGGGIYASTSSNNPQVELNLSSTTISFNSARTGNGGGLYLSRIDTVNITDDGSYSEIASNTAYSAGGGIYVTGGTLTIETVIAGNTLTANRPSGGENIYMYGLSSNNAILYSYESISGESNNDARNYGIYNASSVNRIYLYYITMYDSGSSTIGYATGSSDSIPTWTSGTKTYTSTGEIEVWYPVYKSRVVTVNLNSNGGSLNSGETPRSILWGDSYGGTNLYDTSKVDITSSGLSLSSNIFTLNVTSSNTNQWFNFCTPFYNNQYIRPSSTYTVVLEVLSYSSSSNLGIVICSP